MFARFEEIAEHLELERPLVFLDLESTGVSISSSRIVEIALLKVFPDSSVTFDCRRVNPGTPIPWQATAIHGITDSDVASEPAFRRISLETPRFFEDCDFAGFGITRFDLPLLQNEFRRCGIAFSWRSCAVVDSMVVFHSKERRDLAAATQYYCHRPLLNAHSAADDVRATVAVLGAQSKLYEDLPKTLRALDKFCNPSGQRADEEGKFVDSDGIVKFAFGKHKGSNLSQVVADDPGYLIWMLKQDFSDETKGIVRAGLSNHAPT